MTKYKGRMTAAELMAKLETDPDYQRRMAEKEQTWAEREVALERINRPIMDDLRRLGVTAGSIEETVKWYAPLAPNIVQVLLGWLPRVNDDRVKESLVRALGAAREPFDGRPLVDCFLLDTSGTLRWPIANTMAEARPFGISDWLVQAVKDQSLGDARGMLVLALARLSPEEFSLPLLLSILEELPGYAAKALGEVGGVAELNTLRSLVGKVVGWEKGEFLKAIRKIEKRLQKSP